MQCQHFDEEDPGDRYAHQCRATATLSIRFTYRHGENVQIEPRCANHASDADTLNNWGIPYGHSASLLPYVAGVL